MFSVQGPLKFVQRAVASIVLVAAILSAGGSVPVVAPNADDFTNGAPSGLLAADDFTNGLPSDPDADDFTNGLPPVQLAADDFTNGFQV